MTTKAAYHKEPSSDLPPVTRHITTHREDGKAVIHTSSQGQWQDVHDKAASLNLIFTTSEFPTQMNNEADITAHTKIEEAGTGLVNRGGSVCRIVDFAPGKEPLMHRTKSLDYGVVLEGEMELILDSGETRLLKRGDVAVQRGTMHAWKNASDTQWGRILFVLLDSHPLEVGGEVLKEALGAIEELSSNN
ncbi:cupin domain-containing protein [Sarocladium implicatum]|nr:cupin domain-containing protein [Sarocladium implicatum]